MIPAGKLTRRIQLLMPSSTARRPSGQQCVETYDVVATRRAQRQFKASTETEVGKQIKGSQTAEFTIRYDRTLESFTNRGKVQDAGFVWDLTGPPWRSDDGQDFVFEATCGTDRVFVEFGSGGVSFGGSAGVS